MAGDEDRDSRTEEPTERKIQEAIDKGNVPVSREAITLGSLLAILLAVSLMAPWAAQRFLISLALIIDKAGTLRLGAREDAVSWALDTCAELAATLLPLTLVIAAGGVLAALLQNVPQAAGERVRPKLSRLSPAANWNRIFGRQGLIEFARTTVKVAGVCLVAALVLKADLQRIAEALFAELADVPELLRQLIGNMIATLCGIALGLTIFDVALTRFSWRRSLRMTRQELKEEFKQAEGDPQLKAKARAAARQRRSRNMFAKIPTATMVVTNPTHYAVALRYMREEGGAPVVVAKGLDHLALRIRALAEEHDIPVIENRPLARSLYDLVEIDGVIPPELYRAVAELIHFLHLRGSYGAGRPVV